MVRGGAACGDAGQEPVEAAPETAGGVAGRQHLARVEGSEADGVDDQHAAGRAGFLDPAERLPAERAKRYAEPDRVDLRVVPGMGHALAEEPGVDAAPQTPAAAAVDRLAVDWLGRHLG